MEKARRLLGNDSGFEHDQPVLDGWDGAAHKPVRHSQALARVRHLDA